MPIFSTKTTDPANSKKGPVCVYQVYLSQYKPVDAILDEFISIINTIENQIIDEPLMRYIYKLKLSRNQIKHYRECVICPYVMVQYLLPCYDRCFDKCHKIAKKFCKEKHQDSVSIDEKLAKLKKTMNEEIDGYVRFQLYIDKKYGNKCCCHIIS